LKDIEEALVFLGTASDEGWTVEQARIELNRQLGKEAKKRPQPVGEYEAKLIGVNGGPLRFTTDYFFSEMLDTRRRYRIVVFEMDEDEEVSRNANYQSERTAAPALPASGAPAETG
jgi:hypothetical protein